MPGPRGYWEVESRAMGRGTRPDVFSIHIAFFFWSIFRVPARVEVIVEGGVWWSPGPSFRWREGSEGIGRRDGEMASPGKTRVSVAMVSETFHIFDVFLESAILVTFACDKAF